MTIGASLLLLAFAAADSPKIEFLPPVRLEAGGEIVDTDIGHAAPFHGDIDGDGRKDLLVGQFGGGILWVYRNEGTEQAPRYARRTKFQAGGADGTVPTG
jgi:hypothetical protein